MVGCCGNCFGVDFCGERKKGLVMDNLTGLPIWAMVLIGVIGSGGFVSMVNVTKDLILRYFDLRRRDRSKEVDGFNKLLPLLGGVYDEMNGISTSGGILGVCLMKLENGGGVPVLGSELSCTLLHEVYMSDDGRFREDWRKTSVMSDMMSCLVRMYGVGHCSYASDGGSGSFGRWCKTRGLSGVEFYRLHVESTRVLFLMVCYKHGQTMRGGDVDIEMSIGRLRGLCKRGSV